jgi:hypothetical protein
LERTIVPPEYMEIGLAGISVEEFVKIGEYRHR